MIFGMCNLKPIIGNETLYELIKANNKVLNPIIIELTAIKNHNKRHWVISEVKEAQNNVVSYGV